MESDKCMCGGSLVPYLRDGKIHTFSIATDLPPSSLYICIKCGHWHLFTIALQKEGKELLLSEVPDEVKKNLGLN